MKLTKQFIDAVQILDKAFANLEANWDDNHDDSIELSEAYPFGISISEMKSRVSNWREAILTDHVENNVGYIGPKDLQPQHHFVSAFHIYDQGEHIIESVHSGRTFKKEWQTDPSSEVRQSQSFDPDEIRNMWITYRP